MGNAARGQRNETGRFPSKGDHQSGKKSLHLVKERKEVRDDSLVEKLATKFHGKQTPTKEERRRVPRKGSTETRARITQNEPEQEKVIKLSFTACIRLGCQNEIIDGYYGRWGESGTCSKSCESLQAEVPRDFGEPIKKERPTHF